MSKPSISVLILNYRNPKATVACVNQFLEEEGIEIFVIDNHSEDDSIGVIRNHFGSNERVRIIETPSNRGFGAGYNAGVSYASGEYIFVNNPDKLMQSGGLQTLMQQMETDSSIGIIAPKLLHGDGTHRQSIRRFPRIVDILSRRSVLGKLCPKALSQYLMLDADRDSTQDVEWVVGGCFMIRRDLFTELGGFDERFFLFFEDTDLCRRVRSLGKRIVYFPSVTVADKRDRLSGQSFWDLIFKKTGRIHILSAFRYFWKWRRDGV